MLAFELNVLRRLKFASVILPFAGEPQLGAALKRWNARVSANDQSQAAFVKAVAAIENNGETLVEEDVALVLEDAYVPRSKAQNAALENRFGEIDALWFDNVRANIEKISSHVKQAVAMSIGLSVGDYVFSFTKETREFRQPLSKVYRKLWENLPAPFDNRQENICRNKPAKEFIAENFTADLMFLRLPKPVSADERDVFDPLFAWREEWIHGDRDFWANYEQSRAGKFGAPVQTKAQYLQLLEEVLQTAAHIPSWAIAHTEDGFIPTQDIAETVGRVRRVDTIYTKDFSELTGTKAVIITA